MKPQLPLFIFVVFACSWLRWGSLAAHKLPSVGAGRAAPARRAGLLTVVASLVAERGPGALAREVRGHRLSCPEACGVLWTRDRTMPPALAGRFSTTGPPGKPLISF